MKSIWRILAFVLVIASVIMSQSITPTAAQDGSDDPDEDPNPVAVQSATVNLSDDQFNFTILGEQLDGCDFPLETEATWQSETVLFIDIVRIEDPAGSVMCSSERPAFTIEISLDPYEPDSDDEDPAEDTESIEDQAVIPTINVLINDFLGQFQLVRISVEDGPAITELPVVQLTASRVNLDEVNVEFDEENEEYILSVNGSFPEGCEAPVIARQEQVEQTLSVEIFRPIPEDAVCPAIFLTYEDDIVLEGEFSGIMTIDVNGIPIIYDADTNTQIGVESLTRVPTVIEDAQVLVLESFPPQLVVSIRGYQPDSCQFPVEVDQSVDGNTITLEIYRELPPNVRCAEAIVPYESNINLGSFDPGDYVIDVNGTIVEVSLQ